MAENLVTLTEGNFPAEVINSATPVVVDFWAEWCGPCKMIAPVLSELATEYAGKVKIGKVNIDDHQQLAINYGIQSIPTLLFFKGGKVVEQLVGVHSKADIKKTLDSLVGAQA